MSAEEGHKLLLQLHARVGAHVEQAGVGYVAEAAGDDITVYYGFPTLVERGEEHACALALALVQVRRANQQHARAAAAAAAASAAVLQSVPRTSVRDNARMQDGVQLSEARETPSRTGKASAAAACISIHIGIHAATSIISTPGGAGAASAPARPVAQGEAPGVARQLQQAARAGQTLLSAHVAEAASARFETREAPAAAVRYHGRPLAATVLVGPKASLLDDGDGAPREVTAPPKRAPPAGSVSSSACSSLSRQRRV